MYVYICMYVYIPLKQLECTPKTILFMTFFLIYFDISFILPQLL